MHTDLPLSITSNAATWLESNRPEASAYHLDQIISLSLATLSPIPLELYSSDINLTFYCDNIVGTVPLLRQFATLAVTQTLVRYQVIQSYLIWEYPVW